MFGINAGPGSLDSPDSPICLWRTDHRRGICRCQVAKGPRTEESISIGVWLNPNAQKLGKLQFPRIIESKIRRNCLWKHAIVLSFTVLGFLLTEAMANPPGYSTFSKHSFSLSFASTDDKTRMAGNACLAGQWDKTPIPLRLIDSLI